MDEEGARFGAALFGSRAFVGNDLSELGDRQDSDGISLKEAMAALGFEFERVPTARRVEELGGYLELHIEQGPEQAAQAEGATTLRMPSGAGHDAMEVGRHVPAGMVFVPSRKGISHSPEEFTEPEHCELDARVLARALETLLA
jgi:hypothetical protein